MGAAQAVEFGKYQADDALHLLIGVFDHAVVRQTHKTRRQTDVQFTSASLVHLGSTQLAAHVVPLCFRKGALQSQQHAIFVDLGIVDAAGIADQRAAQAGQVEQAIPIAAIARQPRDIRHQDDPCLLETDRSHQALKPFPPIGGDGALAQIIVDHHHPHFGPAQRAGTLHKLVLQVLALQVLFHLTHGGLADVDIRIALHMLWGNLTARNHASLLAPPSPGTGAVPGDGAAAPPAPAPIPAGSAAVPAPRSAGSRRSHRRSPAAMDWEGLDSSGSLQATSSGRREDTT